MTFQKKTKPPQELNPDELIILDSLDEPSTVKEEEEEKEEKEKEEEEDDDLIPYTMEDEGEETTEDEKEKKKPAYLRQCIEVMKESQSETPEAVLEAMNKVCEIARRKPDDVEELSEQILGAMLFSVHEAAGTKEWEETRHRAMVSITVIAPERSSIFLTKEFYRENHQLSDRFEILEVIKETAIELSTINRQKEKHDSEAMIGSQLIPMNLKKKQIGTDIGMVAGKTRQWHSIRPEEPKPTQNRFLKVSGAFFFPLMCNVDKPVFVDFLNFFFPLFQHKHFFFLF